MEGSLSNKKVYQFKDGNLVFEYPSASIAARIIGISSTAMYILIKKGRTYNGYKFQYQKEYFDYTSPDPAY